ncbi:integrase core domain protein [Plakobranchus ocellatus]|uniref:Integrase core domain protein n=1 Tax=Plakobranchus ocellatus TaxID=259542 RepID=A0AAV4AR82_9GAST|nr:integrase core domain protein [Plakobranchus ocellatus]
MSFFMTAECFYDELSKVRAKAAKNCVLTEVNLIDFQSHPESEYKFKLVYHLDHLTNFVVLRTLETKGIKSSIQAR